MSTQFSFNAAAVAPQAAISLLPAGKYVAQISESEIRATKNQTGRYIALTLEILQGDFAGRKVFSNVNIENANSTAQEIGQAQLSAICHAVGVLNLQDTTQLHGRPLQIRVAIRKGDGKYEDQNDVKGYEAVPVTGGYQSPVTPQVGHQHPHTQQQPAAAAPPWAQVAQ